MNKGGYDQYQDRGFNSMKVRLKRANVVGAANAAMSFQFHEGPIKTAPNTPFNYTSNLFQFHEGPIKTDATTRLPTLKHSFNSMKVRLKQQQGYYIHFVCSMFQFHEGPIKTAYGSADASHAAAFQFHEGPIKTRLLT